LANNVNQSFSLVISGLSPVPAANFTASTQATCTGGQIVFTNTSSASTSRIWYFPGGNPSTSTAINQTVTYSTPGIYAVALKVSNVAGTDSIYKTSFIRIGGMQLPLNETFENNSSTVNLWKITNSYNDTFGWRKWTNTAGTAPGNTVFGINNYDNNIAGKRYQLITPILDLRGMQNASLNFQHAYTRYATSDKDSLIVSISTNCGSTWLRLYGASETRPNAGSRLATYTRNGDLAQTSSAYFVPSSAADWCSNSINSTPCNTINLTPYVGLNNLMVRFESYCGSGNNLFIDNVIIDGTPFSPKAGFTVPSSICTNQSFSITDTSKNNPDTWEYTITGPQNLNFTTKNPVLNLTTSGFYNVKLKVTNVSGSDSVTITKSFEVKASPASPVLTLSGSLAICDADSTLLTTTGSNIQWYKDSVAIVGQNGLTYYNKFAGKIAVRTTATNGCEAQSNILTFITGTRPPVPIVTKSLSGNVFCDGGSFVLTSNATAANQWQKNGLDLVGETGTALNYNDSGTFTVKVTNGACFALSAPITLSKLTKPVTSEISASRFAYKNDTAVYSVTGLPTSTFAWTVNGGTIQSGQSTNSIIVKWSTGSVGVVQVTEKGNNLCNGTLKTYPVGIWNTSVNNIVNQNEILLYPNPANNVLKIQYLGKNLNDFQVAIFDVLGKNILNQKVSISNKEEQSLDITHLPKGIYFVKITGNQFSVSKTITKE